MTDRVPDAPGRARTRPGLLRPTASRRAPDVVVDCVPPVGGDVVHGTRWEQAGRDAVGGSGRYGHNTLGPRRRPTAAHQHLDTLRPSTDSAPADQADTSSAGAPPPLPRMAPATPVSHRTP